MLFASEADHEVPRYGCIRIPCTPHAPSLENAATNTNQTDEIMGHRAARPGWMVTNEIRGNGAAWFKRFHPGLDTRETASLLPFISITRQESLESGTGPYRKCDNRSMRFCCWLSALHTSHYQVRPSPTDPLSTYLP
ncbi:hypothetical protein CHU98_g3794 [Xylaria longipes]|nr:hypothetical protein CHU98_g3794 [Xylaria longipes]